MCKIFSRVPVFLLSPLPFPLICRYIFHFVATKSTNSDYFSISTRWKRWSSFRINWTSATRSVFEKKTWRKPCGRRGCAFMPSTRVVSRLHFQISRPSPLIQNRQFHQKIWWNGINHGRYRCNVIGLFIPLVRIEISSNDITNDLVKKQNVNVVFTRLPSLFLDRKVFQYSSSVINDYFRFIFPFHVNVIRNLFNVSIKPNKSNIRN